MINGEEYRAPKPRYTAKQCCQFLSLRVVFSPILLWDFVKFVGNKSLGKKLGKKILMAQEMEFKYISSDIEAEYAEAYPELFFKKTPVITYDHVNLDTLEIYTPAFSFPKKHIIYFSGNAMCYQDILDEMIEDVLSLDVVAVGFNFRGVRNKDKKIKAQSSYKLVVDGIAQVERLLAEGVPSEQIFLKGHSLGAGIASYVALYFHNTKRPIYIFNGRSFSSLTNFAVGRIRLGALTDQITSLEEKPGNKVLGWVAKPFIKVALLATGWEINAYKAFKKIPPAYREYVAIKKEPAVFDEIIPHYASMYKALSSERKQQTQVVDKKIEALSIMLSQTPDSQLKEDLSKQYNALKESRTYLGSNRQLTPRNSLTPETPHQARLSCLFSSSGKTAQLFFQHFITTPQEHIIKEEKGIQNEYQITVLDNSSMG